MTFTLDAEVAAVTAAAIEQNGPPPARAIAGSRLHNLKELRSGSSSTAEVRILFIFDPARNAVLLVGGDKSGRWDQWYRDAIPAAEAAYEAYLKGRAQR
jgi:hypothetical protein